MTLRFPGLADGLTGLILTIHGLGLGLALEGLGLSSSINYNITLTPNLTLLLCMTYNCIFSYFKIT